MTADLTLTPSQQSVVNATGSLFVVGPAGAGKTTALQQRVLTLLRQREPAYTILVLVADREQRQAYTTFVQRAAAGSFADLKIGHYSSLTREMVILFWPLVARDAGFRSGFQPPTFLGYDLAQLMMWRIITPLLGRGAFANVRLKPQQIMSQLLDTLSRAALNNLDIMEATQRQISTWTGEPDHVLSLEQAYQAAILFRQHCQSHNLLDLSLTIETFNRHVLGHPEFSRYFSERFRHLLVDNLDEQTPAGQFFVRQLLPQTVTTVLAYDEGGGYRRFLAADPIGAARLSTSCRQLVRLEESFSSSPAIQAVSQTVEAFLHGQSAWAADAGPTPLAPDVLKLAQTAILQRVMGRYRREMVFRLAQQLAELVRVKNVPAREIAVIVPYMDGAMQYSLLRAFKGAGVPMNLVRRRASPREEPRVRAWLTWTALAHPEWGLTPTEFDVAEALTLSLNRLDPARAALLAQRLYDTSAGRLRPADELAERYQERVGADILGPYEQLRQWLAAQRAEQRLDHFLYQLFADLLSQPMFQPEPDLAGAAVCGWLVQTATRLCDSAESLGLLTPTDIGQAFLDSINQGLVTTQPPDTGDPPDPEGVIITTIYGYLLHARPVQVQVWLETAASGWWDIPRQPLSNAFVLSPGWDPQQGWTAAHEIDLRNQLLSRIIVGLTNRCRGGIILATSELDRRGQRQDGTLWRALETARELSQAAAA